MLDPYARNSDRIVTVFGGSGFLGRQVVRALAKRGYRVRAASRRPNLAGHLQPLGGTGQIAAVRADLRDPASAERAISGAYAVVNLVGILFEGGGRTFDSIQAKGPRLIGEQAKAAGAERVVHVSAIGADAGSPSQYARTKAEGERGLLAAFPQAVILRPSIVFGPEDSFFNRFASMAAVSPVLPVVGPNVRFQPAYVGDVAEAVALSVEGRATPGAIYELGGPEIRTFREFLRLMLDVIGQKRLIAALPTPIAMFQASILEKLPGTPILTQDQVLLLKRDNVVSDEAIRDGRTFAAFGISPQAPSAVLPTYMARFRRFGQFTEAPRPASIKSQDPSQTGRTDD